LDVSSNLALTELWCSDNQLNSLNVSNNTALEYLIIEYIPTLHEVCVWESFPSGVQVVTAGSPNVQFTTDCAVTVLNTFKLNSTIDIYPNPSDDIINIDIEGLNNAIIEIYNVSGRLVFSKALNSKVVRIDISGFPMGVYLLKVRQADSVYVEKVVVK
ncbi:MAG: T9SS type A sorting domain-containing protein, partial [Bacteroidales bacterium]